MDRLVLATCLAALVAATACADGPAGAELSASISQAAPAARESDACRLPKTLADDIKRLDESANFDGAIAALRRALDSLAPAERDSALAMIADYHRRLGQFADAETLYREIVNSSQKSSATEVRGWEFELAQVLRLRQKFDEARQVYDKLAAADSTAADAADLAALESWYWLAWLDHRDGDIAAGRRRVDSLLGRLQAFKDAESPPRRADELRQFALYLKSQLEIAAHDEPAAIATLDALRNGAPRDPLLAQAEFWRAELAFRRGEDETARELFAQVALRTAALKEPWTALAPLRLAQLEASRQRWNDVLVALEWLEWRWPDFSLAYEVHYLRGRAHAGRGEFPAARDSYHRVLDDPDARGTETAAMAQWMIGETYFHQRVFAEARTAYQQTIDEHVHAEWQARAALQLGKCWELEGGWDKAAAVYSAAAERFAATESAPQLAARCQFVDHVMRK